MYVLAVVLIVLGITTPVVGLVVYLFHRSLGSWHQFPGAPFWLIPPGRTTKHYDDGLSRTSRAWLVGVHWSGRWIMCHGARAPSPQDIKRIWPRIEKRVYRRFRRAGYSLESPVENA